MNKQDWYINTQKLGRKLESGIPISCEICGWTYGFIIVLDNPPSESSLGSEELHCEQCGKKVK